MSKHKQKTKEKPTKKRAAIEAQINLRERRQWKLISRQMITMDDVPAW